VIRVETGYSRINFNIVARYDQAVRVRQTLTAQKIMTVYSDDKRTYTCNVGANMVGVPSVKIPAGRLKKGDRNFLSLTLNHLFDNSLRMYALPILCMFLIPGYPILRVCQVQA
jgi:hypothetical protein